MRPVSNFGKFVPPLSLRVVGDPAWGVSYALLMGDAALSPAFTSRGGNDRLTFNAGIVSGGYGFGMTPIGPALLGNANYIRTTGTGGYAPNQAVGSALFVTTPDFNPGDGFIHQAWMFISADQSRSLGVVHFNDGNIYAGWTASGSDSRVVLPVAGLWSSGVPTTITLTWNKSTNTTRFYTGGVLRASNTASTIITSDLSMDAFGVGVQPLPLALNASPWVRTAAGLQYAMILFDQELTAAQVLELNRAPFACLRPANTPMRRRGIVAAASSRPRITMVA